jgi:hypothetical protein
MKDFRSLEVWKKDTTLRLLRIGLREHFRQTNGSDLSAKFAGQQHLSGPTLPKDAAAEVTLSFTASFKWQWDRPANWNTTFYSHAISSINPTNHKELTAEVTRVKRMLSSLIRTVDESREKARAASA